MKQFRTIIYTTALLSLSLFILTACTGTDSSVNSSRPQITSPTLLYFYTDN